MTKTAVGHPSPHPSNSDVHAEAKILGAMLTSAIASTYASVTLDAGHFTDPRHQEIFAAAASLTAAASLAPAGVASDPINVTNALKRRGQVPAEDLPDTAAYLHTLAHDAPPELLIGHYAAIIRDLAALRSKHRPTTEQRPAGPYERRPPMPMRGFLIDEDEQD